MIKRILVALDPDTDTPVAIQYAVEIARRFEATVTGLAVVDMKHVEHEARGGGIGSMYYAEKLRENLVEETRQKARELVAEFKQEMEGTGVQYQGEVKEGEPYGKIVDAMKYNDLLVIGQEPHFFYAHPKQRTETLVKVVKRNIGPTLVVGHEHRSVKRILIAYDGSAASARAMRRYVHLDPFGDGLTLDVLNIYEKDSSASEYMLARAKAYLEVHGHKVQVVSRKGEDAAREIVAYAKEFEADLVVAGAHSVSKLTRLAFGSTTATLMHDCPSPLFLDN